MNRRQYYTSIINIALELYKKCAIERYEIILEIAETTAKILFDKYNKVVIHYPETLDFYRKHTKIILKTSPTITGLATIVTNGYSD
jgi:hypothetical protein